jgi:hypothetical protein
MRLAISSIVVGSAAWASTAQACSLISISGEYLDIPADPIAPIYFAAGFAVMAMLGALELRYKRYPVVAAVGCAILLTLLTLPTSLHGDCSFDRSVPTFALIATGAIATIRVVQLMLMKRNS